MAMQVILTQDVDNLGKAGELVSVRPGYGRNYLVPRGLAVSATVRNKNRLDHEKSLIEKRVAKERANANDLATKINAITLQLELLTGDEDKVFGSVTSRELSERLKKAGVDVDHRTIQLEAPIKALGKYETTVRLSAGVVATLKFWVVGKEK
jgi:large subunit ribosomal protein L9